jgi:Fur family ferric uptake transcriptional regulator
MRLGDPFAKFRDYLNARGKEFTRVRELIVDEVLWTWGPFGFDEFFERLSNRTGGCRVSRATIYRSLLDMVDAGLLRREVGEQFCRVDLVLD